MLLAAGKQNRWAKFYGADVDHTCALMTLINLTLNCLYGEVSWMDSLSNRWYGGWAIEPTVYGCPRISPITSENSLIMHREIKPIEEKKIVPVQLPEFDFPKHEEVKKPVSQLVFDF